MKNLGRILLIAVFVVPIIVCILVLKNIWEDDDKDTKKSSSGVIVSISDTVYTSGEEILSGDGSNSSGETLQMGNETFVTNIGDPISKMYTDAKISAALTNVYLEANESSEVVGKLERPTVVIAQKFPEGWSRVSVGDGSISGWVKTANISYPSDASNLNTDSSSSKKGTISAKPYLNMRTTPSTSAKILTTIPDGTAVTIIESTNGWHKVTYNGYTGWVNSSYVK